MARRTRPKLALPLLGLILLLGAAAYTWSPPPRSADRAVKRAPTPPAPPAHDPAPARGGIHGRDVDPATHTHDGGWYVDDGDQHAPLADKSVDASMLAIQNPADPQMLEVEMWAMGAADDYKLMRAAYQCERQFLIGLERTCDFRLRMVIHREQGTTGKVTFVKPTSEQPMDAPCQAYSTCLANRVFLGEPAPMPSSSGELVAIHMDHRLVPFQGPTSAFQPTIEAELATLRREHRQMQDNPDLDPRELQQMEALLKFMALRNNDPS